MKTFTLTLTHGLHCRLQQHLFPGDGEEHGAVIAAGMAETQNGMRLLGREVFLANDGRDYVRGQRGYRMLTAEFVRDVALYCRDERLCYLAVHNHDGYDQVGFSVDDIASHERGYPPLLALLRGRPVGALVLARNAIAGDLFTLEGRLHLSHATVLGAKRRVLRPSGRETADADPRYDRQSRLFGDQGQHILADLTVGVIGAGGVGSLVVEYLARLGVGSLLIVDPDRIEASNLPRVVDSGVDDLGQRWQWLPMPLRRTLRLGRPATKVMIAKRVAARANPECRVEAIHGDFLHTEVARRFLDCDYIFLAADSMRCRLLYNAIAHQYLIPGAQIGAKVQVDTRTGKLVGVFTVVRPANLDGGCLWCNGLIPPSRLQSEAATAQERLEQRYVNDPLVVAPSVITLNAVGASYAVNEFLFTMLGIRSSQQPSLPYFRVDSLTGDVVFDEPRVGNDCPECSATSSSRQARGDGALLPSIPSGV